MASTSQAPSPIQTSIDPGHTKPVASELKKPRKPRRRYLAFPLLIEEAVRIAARDGHPTFEGERDIDATLRIYREFICRLDEACDFSLDLAMVHCEKFTPRAVILADNLTPKRMHPPGLEHKIQQVMVFLQTEKRPRWYRLAPQ